MGLSIKNADVERMIRALAERRGVPMTEALRQLLAEEEARAAAARETAFAEKMRIVREIQARVAALPVVSTMTDDEILGYDDNGIPTR